MESICFSESQLPVDEMFSQGSRCLSAGRIVQHLGYSSGRVTPILHDNGKTRQAASIDVMMRSLMHNNWIRIVDFSGIDLGSARASEQTPASAPINLLASMLRSNTSITELRLNILEFNRAEFRQLRAALECNATIKTLAFHGKRSHESVKYGNEFDGVLMGLLRQVDRDGQRCHVSVIESVILKDVSCKDGFSTRELGAALKSNETLTSIDLGEHSYFPWPRNPFTEILDAIEHNPRIIRFVHNKENFADDDEEGPETTKIMDRILKARRSVSLAFFGASV
jgi:hypothetical protein